MFSKRGNKMLSAHGPSKHESPLEGFKLQSRALVLVSFSQPRKPLNNPEQPCVFHYWEKNVQAEIECTKYGKGFENCLFNANTLKFIIHMSRLLRFFSKVDTS